MAAHASARVARAAKLRGIYAIVNEGEPNPVEIARAALAGGVRIVQYRAKRGIDPARLRALRDATAEAQALLIVNDDWRAALAFDCDGVHLGPGDDGFGAVATVRAAIGERLIGLSCGTPQEVDAANAAGADYVGIGAVYATASKADAGAPIGVEGLRALAGRSAVPVAAIGGIGADRIPAVAETGVAMAAVISALAASDPERAARDLVARWQRAAGGAALPG